MRTLIANWRTICRQSSLNNLNRSQWTSAKTKKEEPLKASKTFLREWMSHCLRMKCALLGKQILLTLPSIIRSLSSLILEGTGKSLLNPMSKWTKTYLNNFHNHQNQSNSSTLQSWVNKSAQKIHNRKPLCPVEQDLAVETQADGNWNHLKWMKNQKLCTLWLMNWIALFSQQVSATIEVMS